jgi:hypothetical protein
LDGEEAYAGHEFKVPTLKIKSYTGIMAARPFETLLQYNPGGYEVRAENILRTLAGIAK